MHKDNAMKIDPDKNNSFFMMIHIVLLITILRYRKSEPKLIMKEKLFNWKNEDCSHKNRRI